MITLRRAGERHREGRGRHELWSSFPSSDGTDRLARGFGILTRFEEERLPPGAVVRQRPLPNDEWVLFVHSGTLAFTDARGGSDIVRAGEFQRQGAAPGDKGSQHNASRSDWARLFRMRLARTASQAFPGREQRRFSAAERRGSLCVVASADARRGSLRLHHDALICSALLEPGQHMVHELTPGRAAWLHLVQGTMQIADDTLATGDGAGFTAESRVSLTAREEAEILLVDLTEPAAAAAKEPS